MMFTPRTVWTGGTVGCVIAAPTSNDQEALFAGTATGVLVSTDAGRSWKQTSPHPIAFVETLAAASFTGSPRVLLAGGPSGLHWSNDDGVSWQRHFAAHVHALTTCEGRGGEHCVIVGTKRDGVIRSGDGGSTWDSANPGLLDPTVLTLAVSPLHAGARTVVAGTASGISISRNEGKAWRPSVVPDDEPVVQCLAVSPHWAEDRSALAGTESSGLLRTADGGLTWQAVPSFAGRGIAAIAWTTDVAADPLIAAASGRDILLSTDDGQSWRHLAEAPGEIATLWLGSDDGSPILLAGLFDLGLVRFA
jgi:photosystem II stability/assembly factor-like uncharacterized protein